MRALRILAAVFALFAALLVIVWGLWRDEPTANTAHTRFDIILVLGTPALQDGTPSPVQRSRVLEGVRQWKMGAAPRLVMSGGPAHNQWVESDTMAKLAESQGVPASDVFEERQAHDTIQNIYYTVQIMQAHGWKSAEVVSTWSHLPRAAMILQHFPIEWRTQAAPWPPHFGFLNKAVRDWNEAQYCLTLRLRDGLGRAISKQEL
jgi:uncharacterized SAM-binding protein YcdF (DUF218 family)